MPPPFAPVRALAIRPRPRGALSRYRPSIVANRAISEQNNPGKLPEAEPGERGPNTQQQEHVSEEAAKMAKIEGKEGPDLDQGTPVQDIIKEEKEQREHAPEVVKQEAGTPNPQPSTSTGGTRQFSTYARRRLPELQYMSPSEPLLDPSMLPTSNDMAAYTNPGGQVSKVQTTAGIQTGHKFPLPPIASIPVKPNTQKKSRQRQYAADNTPIVVQLTNLLMRDGKKSVAERNMATILSSLRTLPAPTYSATRPLLPHTPPASHLPLNPIAYLTAAVDSVAPLMRIRSQRGAAGGGVALQIPVPLGLRQRRRTAFTWILDAASKRANRGSGKDMFPQRVAQELVAVVEGRSGVWEKRQAVHRMATAARTNVGWNKLGGRR